MTQHDTNIQIGNLDFESIKSSITDHLKGQSDIKDYDYEGGDYDEAYENNDHESDQHQEDCDWIYGNCNCKLITGDDE